MQTMHLFAGAGGGLLADLILGHEPVIAVEWDKYCCAVLRERAAEGWFPSLQVWEGDVRMFNPSEYAGQVDCIHAGFPCQDISVAGKQAGVGPETRSGLYREVLRIAGVVRPRYLFLENVAAIRTKGLETVLADLAAIGYDTEWLCLRASDCGAKHHRDRWWLLAHSEKLQRNGSDDHAGIGMELGSIPEFGNGCWQKDMAEPNSKREPQQERYYENQWRRIGDSSEFEPDEDVAHSDSSQCEGRSVSSGVHEKDADIGCGGWWEVEPDVGRVANGVASGMDQLKATGNGQVPLQAALAWKLLGGP